ncbi:flavin-containing monooxygenase 5-like [Engraulis encrasicolus]|uniref:flavin-containing monooxygenase 5-like n=1 Tax=Engraulis encrasicolus TaxID=184585 RepID=UPI002FD2CF03
MAKRVAVIGAGCSGLAAIKCCLDEGLEPVCFESSDDIGGLWRFKEKPEAGRANIYQSVIVNSSKEMMAYSDFPPPAHFPNNMHHTQVLQYLWLYAAHYGLLKHVHLQTAVKTVRQRPDFAGTGQWEVVTEKRDGEEQRHVFDAVMVCTGHFTRPHLPLQDFKGIDTFEGRHFHSWEYRNADGLQDKTVVVIGIGNSGGDIAVDASRVAKQVYLSTRRGAWLVGRVGEGGLPCDVVSGVRLALLIGGLMPSWATQSVEKQLNQRFNHKLYGLQPTHGFFAQIPVVNDDLPGRIISGRVIIKPNVKQFSGSSVVFEDGTQVHKVDVVVFATGYHYDFPFLPEELRVREGYRLSLYKHVFPPGLQRATLAVVGFIHALGAVIPLAEMQARWATRVFKGLATLPSKREMLEDIQGCTKTMHQRFACSERNPLQTDYIPYMDDIAREVGAHPRFLSLLLRDPGLGLRVLLGPCTPYQYRLCGPGQWEGARHAIYTQWDRVLRPFATRTLPESEEEKRSDTEPSWWRGAPPRLGTVMAASMLFAIMYFNKRLALQ